MRVHEEEFPIFLPKLTYPSPRPGVAESQITSPADQSKPLAEERASLAYLRRPTRSPELNTSTPPRADQSEQLLASARQRRQPMRLASQPNTPSSLAPRPRGAPGVCPTGGGKAGKRRPRRPAVTAPRETTHQPGAGAGAAGARPRRPRPPRRRRLTAPRSRASSVTHRAAGPAYVARRSR